MVRSRCTSASSAPVACAAFVAGEGTYQSFGLGRTMRMIPSPIVYYQEVVTYVTYFQKRQAPVIESRDVFFGLGILKSRTFPQSYLLRSLCWFANWVGLGSIARSGNSGR